MAGVPHRRARQDVLKLSLSGFDVVVDEEPQQARSGLSLVVRDFRGPADTPFAGGVFVVAFFLPTEYPFKSPSVGFRTRIFHPNIEADRGGVCLDVLNSLWSPLYDLHNVLTELLPQLLTDPNPQSPLNQEAAALLLNSPDEYKRRAREYVLRFATPPTHAASAPASASSSASSAASSSASSSTSSSSSVASSSASYTSASSSSAASDAAVAVALTPAPASVGARAANRVGRGEDRDVDVDDDDSASDGALSDELSVLSLT